MGIKQYTGGYSSLADSRQLAEAMLGFRNRDSAIMDAGTGMLEREREIIDKNFASEKEANTESYIKAIMEGKKPDSYAGAVDTKRINEAQFDFTKYTADMALKQAAEKRAMAEEKRLSAAQKGKMSPMQKMILENQLKRNEKLWEKENHMGTYYDKDTGGGSNNKILKDLGFFTDYTDEGKGTADSTNAAEANALMAAWKAKGANSKALKLAAAKAVGSGNWMSGFTGFDEMTFDADVFNRIMQASMAAKKIKDYKWILKNSSA